MNTDKTKVIFRKDFPENGGEVLAVFPALAGDSNPFSSCSYYAHMGQHSTMSLDYYIKSTTPATPAEYASLKADLESIGYDLQVAKRTTCKDLQARIEQTAHFTFA